MDADGIEKFHLMKRDYLTVLPCCTGVCAVGPTKGWITKGKSKRNIRAGKRKAICMNINLTTFQPRPIGNTVESLQDCQFDSRVESAAFLTENETPNQKTQAGEYDYNELFLF